MTSLLALAALLACSPDEPAPDEPADEVLLAVTDLWEDEDLDGDTVTLEVVVTSPRTVDGAAFFVASRDGSAGLRVLPVGTEPELPPAMGRALRITGEVDLSGPGPSLWIEDSDDAVPLGLQEVPIASWDDGDELLYLPVRLSGVTVRSSPDPSGRADLDAPVDLGGVFGAPPPGWGTTGELVGVLSEPGRLSPRSQADWSGPFEGEPPLDLDLADLREDPPADGTPVRLQGVVQATPWSRGLRWVVVQDAEGRGIWVDAEGWGVGGGGEGDLLSWTGEVRTDGEGLRLRTWWEPEVTGVAEVVEGDELVDGAVAEVTLRGLEGPDELGWWTADSGVRLCDRFVELVDVVDGSWAGVVRVSGGEVWLCPL